MFLVPLNQYIRSSLWGCICLLFLACQSDPPPSAPPSEVEFPRCEDVQTQIRTECCPTPLSLNELNDFNREDLAQLGLKSFTTCFIPEDSS